MVQPAVVAIRLHTDTIIVPWACIVFTPYDAKVAARVRLLAELNERKDRF